MSHNYAAAHFEEGNVSLRVAGCTNEFSSSSGITCLKDLLENVENRVRLRNERNESALNADFHDVGVQEVSLLEPRIRDDADPGLRLGRIQHQLPHITQPFRVAQRLVDIDVDYASFMFGQEVTRELRVIHQKRFVAEANDILVDVSNQPVRLEEVDICRDRCDHRQNDRTVPRQLQEAGWTLFIKRPARVIGTSGVFGVFGYIVG